MKQRLVELEHQLAESRQPSLGLASKQQREQRVPHTPALLTPDPPATFVTWTPESAATVGDAAADEMHTSPPPTQHGSRPGRSSVTWQPEFVETAGYDDYIEEQMGPEEQGVYDVQPRQWEREQQRQMGQQQRQVEQQRVKLGQQQVTPRQQQQAQPHALGHDTHIRSLAGKRTADFRVEGDRAAQMPRRDEGRGGGRQQHMGGSSGWGAASSTREQPPPPPTAAAAGLHQQTFSQGYSRGGSDTWVDHKRSMGQGGRGHKGRHIAPGRGWGGWGKSSGRGSGY
jgi:hypothetical protein